MKHIVSMLTRDEYIILPIPAPDTADSRIPPRSTFPRTNFTQIINEYGESPPS